MFFRCIHMTSSDVFLSGWLTFFVCHIHKYLGITLRFWSWIEKSRCFSKNERKLKIWIVLRLILYWNYLQIITNLPLLLKFWRFRKSFGEFKMSLKPKRVDFNTTWADLKETVKGVITFSNVPRATWNDRFTGNSRPISSSPWYRKHLFLNCQQIILSFQRVLFVLLLGRQKLEINSTPF